MASFADSYSLAQKKYNDADRRISAICNTIVIISLILAFLASPLAEHFFSYEVTKEIMEKESYEHPIGTVNTYICYTTDYGDCYHAMGCGSLWKSSHKTTVYEAENRGYRSCSKCTPRERTTLTLTETRYRDVTRTETETKEPAFLVWLCGTGCLAVVYYVLTIELKKQRAEASTEMQRIKEEETKIQREQAEREARRKEEERQANNMRVLHSLGADLITLPKDVTLLQDGTPVRGQTSRSYPYGTYTVFISPSGRKFHRRRWCYRNLSAIHLFKLPKGYTPCKNCASSMQYPIILPTWYTELMARKNSQSVNLPQNGNRDNNLQTVRSEMDAYEHLFKILKIGSGIKSVDDAIATLSRFYLSHGREIPKDLYTNVARLSDQEKYKRMFKIMELGSGVAGIENVTNRFIDFYKGKGITFPDDVL